MLFRRTLAHAMLVSAAAFACAAAAQNYPTKPVRVVVTFPPGGSSMNGDRLIGAVLDSISV